jgi:hypothetical protein
MGKQKERRLLVQRDNYAPRDAFLLCETPGCKNVVADWAIPSGYSGPVICTSCTRSKESE